MGALNAVLPLAPRSVAPALDRVKQLLVSLDSQEVEKMSKPLELEPGVDAGTGSDLVPLVRFVHKQRVASGLRPLRT